MATRPLRLVQRDIPEPGPGELSLRVLACGVCRTDLHVAEGDLPPHLPGVTPGHEVVGAVVTAGPGCRHAAGDRGGVLAIAGIHLSDVPVLNYQRHLFQEREIRSVTANTRAHGEEFLRLAGRRGLAVTTTPYDLADADRALTDLAAGRVRGAAVLIP